MNDVLYLAVQEEWLEAEPDTLEEHYRTLELADLLDKQQQMEETAEFLQPCYTPEKHNMTKQDYIREILNTCSTVVSNLRVEDLYETKRSTTEPGDWQNEPDRVTWYNSKLNLIYCANRHGLMGHWCGYVGIPKGHLLEDRYSLDFYGGVTYAEASLECYKPCKEEPDIKIWLGFDCNHIYDVAPFQIQLREQDLAVRNSYKNISFVIKDLITATTLAFLEESP